MATNKLWESDRYYEKARESSSFFDYPGMKVLKKYSLGCSKILDLGCGDGTRLSYISKNKKDCIGVDISKKAINIAKKQYPKCEFRVMNLEHLSFRDNNFDLVYSAFVLEHLDNPEKVISEAIRVLKKSGLLILMAPNYGAPNRTSPVGRYSRSKKLIEGFLQDIIRLFNFDRSLDWRKVTPKYMDNPERYEIDCDTTVEPYIGSLKAFLVKNSFIILESSSLWLEESKSGSFVGSVIKLFGKLGIYPFNYWGPHLLIVARKK